MLQEASEEAMRENFQTEPRTMIFCPSTNESVDDNTFPACYGNVMTVAADNIYDDLLPASKINVDIVVPGENVEADAPVEVRRFVNETMSSVAPALAAGIASLALLLLRIHNDDEAALRKFLQKHKIMQVFEKMGNGQSGIQLSELFGNLGGDDIASRWKITNFS